MHSGCKSPRSIMFSILLRLVWHTAWRPKLLITFLIFLTLTSPPVRTAYVQGSCEPNLRFASALHLGTGSHPQAIAAGDLNGDAIPDLAVANSYESSVSILLNTTAPSATTASFANQVRTTSGLAPYGVALGDFDGDSKRDLVAANNGVNSVSMLRNDTPPQNPSLSFTNQITITTPPHPSATAVSDINGDGKLDVVVANAGGSNASVFLNRTTPTGFAFVQKTIETGDGPSAIAVDDFNADGKPDLAITNMYAANVSVLLNTTAPDDVLPFFASQSFFPAGLAPLGVASGDLNSDTKPDLVIANNFYSTLTVLRNTTPAGSMVANFVAAPDFSAGAGPYAAALADFDADGRPDLIVTNEFSNTVSIFANQTVAGASTIRLLSRGTVNVGARPHAIATDDLNGDGMLDLAIADTDADSVSILLNQARPATLGATGGTPQDGWLHGQFAMPLEVKVLDGCGAAMPGVRVIYQAPIGDAGATLSTATAVTDQDGLARVIATANGVAGSYTVSARISGTNTSAEFHLTNRLIKVFVPLLKT
jgi:hypothetical protein